MTMEEIKSLPVSELADKDCAMFMWTTLPMLRESFSVLDRWGFEYKTVAFVWIKKNRKADSLFWGMGYWTRSNAEVCLLATRGNPKRLAANVHQVIISRIEEHSRNELRVREYDVDVGVVAVTTRNEDGKNKRVQYEVDFVANRGSKRYYIQSAFAIPDEEKREQETRSLIRRLGQDE